MIDLEVLGPAILQYGAYKHLYQQYGAIKGTFALTQQLLRKLAFKPTTFDKYELLTDTDIANLRRNMTELICFGSMLGASIALKAAVIGSTEDDKQRRMALQAIAPFYAVINVLNRTGNDLAFYTDPKAFQQLQSNIFPIFKTVSDFYTVMKRGMILLVGGDDEYHSGEFAHQSKFLESAKKFAPGITIVERLKALNYQLWNKQ